MVSATEQGAALNKGRGKKQDQDSNSILGLLFAASTDVEKKGRTCFTACSSPDQQPDRFFKLLDFAELDGANFKFRNLGNRI